MISTLNQKIIDRIDAGDFPVVRITNKFQLDDSIDPGFVVKILSYKIEHHELIKFTFVITPEVYPICKEIAVPTFYDKNGRACLDWFQARMYNNFDGTNYKDDLYINYEDNEWAQILSELELNNITTKDKYQIESEDAVKLDYILSEIKYLTQEVADLKKEIHNLHNFKPEFYEQFRALTYLIENKKISLF